MTFSQREALVALGNTVEGHDFIPPAVLNDLLSMDLVYWREPDQLDFTAAGERLLDELSGSAVS